MVAVWSLALMALVAAVDVLLFMAILSAQFGRRRPALWTAGAAAVVIGFATLLSIRPPCA